MKAWHLVQQTGTHPNGETFHMSWLIEDDDGEPIADVINEEDGKLIVELHNNQGNDR